MSILEEFPDFRDVPNNVSNRFQWVVASLMSLKKEIDGLKAQAAESGRNGPHSSSGATTAAVGPMRLNLGEYPEFKTKDRLQTLQKHFEVLGGQPSRQECLCKLAVFQGRPVKKEDFAGFHKVSKDEAVAWLYILKKRGWIAWSDEAGGMILTKNSPVPEQTT